MELSRASKIAPTDTRSCWYTLEVELPLIKASFGAFAIAQAIDPLGYY